MRSKNIISLSNRGKVTSMAEQMSQAARAQEALGNEMIYLNVGAPSTGAPSKAIAKVIEVERGSLLGYSAAAGIPELRQRIADHYAQRYNVKVDPGRIIVTFGASGAFQLAFTACFDVDAKIAVPMPCYGAYTRVISSMSLEAIGFNTTKDHHFQPVVSELEALAVADGLIVTSPGNPTGSMVSPQQMADIVTYCNRKGICLISDEIYHGIVYNPDLPATTALQYSDDVIVTNSFSKYYSMPGWRLGWMVVPDYLVDPMCNLARSLYVSPSAPAQYAALSAMDCEDELKEHVKHYTENREVLMTEMPKAGFNKFAPMDGAFYCYAHVEHLHHDSLTYCLKMIEDIGVVASPGIAYDPHHGHRYVRFSYAGSTDKIKAAIEKLKKWQPKW